VRQQPCRVADEQHEEARRKRVERSRMADTPRVERASCVVYHVV